jgi:hypothetical protein
MKALPPWHQEYVRYIRASRRNVPSTSWAQAKRQTDAVLAGKNRLDVSNGGSLPTACVFPSLPLKSVS